jgi:hypothetical protein
MRIDYSFDQSAPSGKQMQRIRLTRVASVWFYEVTFNLAQPSRLDEMFDVKEKPEEFYELDGAVDNWTKLQEMIPRAKNKIAAALSKLGDPAKSEQIRLGYAKRLMREYAKIPGITRSKVAKKLLGCSALQMEQKFGRTCSRCGASVEFNWREIHLGQFFRHRSLGKGWECVKCAEIPEWIMQTRKLKDKKSVILRRFDQYPFSLDNYTYSMGSLAMVRMPRLLNYQEPDYPERPREEAIRLESYLASGNLGFVVMPNLPKLVPHARWKAVFYAGNKKFQQKVLSVLDKLPGIEIAPKISGPDEPMVFRFEYGQGMIMPLRSDQTMESALSYYLSGSEWALKGTC